MLKHLVVERKSSKKDGYLTADLIFTDDFGLDIPLHKPLLHLRIYVFRGKPLIVAHRSIASFEVDLSVLSPCCAAESRSMIVTEAEEQAYPPGSAFPVEKIGEPAEYGTPSLPLHYCYLCFTVFRFQANETPTEVRLLGVEDGSWETDDRRENHALLAQWLQLYDSNPLLLQLFLDELDHRIALLTLKLVGDSA